MRNIEHDIYFLAGYIYALAEDIVQSKFPSLSDFQKKKEILNEWKYLISAIDKGDNYEIY